MPGAGQLGARGAEVQYPAFAANELFGRPAGAGLGRLCLELTNLGLEVQGNEFSYYMLLASSFMLNNTSRANQWTVFPWLHSNCNQKSVADQLRGVKNAGFSTHACRFMSIDACLPMHLPPSLLS